MSKFTNGETVKCIDDSGFAKGLVVKGNWYIVCGETPYGDVKLAGIAKRLDNSRFIHFSEAGGLIETPPKSLLTVDFNVHNSKGKSVRFHNNGLTLDEAIIELQKMVVVL